MTRWPVALVVVAAAAVVAPLSVVALIAEIGGRGLEGVITACSRLSGTVVSVPFLIAFAVAASCPVFLAVHGCRQWRVSTCAVSLARLHAVSTPASIEAVRRTLAIPRLLVADLPTDVAFCAGLFRPTVVVSRQLVERLDPAALTAVLAHEAAHAIRRDPLRQVLWHSVARGLWMFPLARSIAEHHRLLVELRADRAALAEVGRSALARALLSLHQAPPPLPMVGVARGVDMLEARVDALVDPTSTAVRPALVGPVVWSAVWLLAGIVLAFIGASVVPPASRLVLPMPMDAVAILEMTTSWMLRAGVVVAVLALADATRRAGPGGRAAA